MFEAKQNPRELWESVCRRVGADVLTIEDAKSGDPHDFVAEPLKPAKVGELATLPQGDVRAGWTSASNALADSLCPGRHIAQRGIPEPVKGDDAMTGTRIHASLATETLPATLTLEERETFDACREIEKKVVSQFFGDAALKVFRHERLWVGEAIKHSGEPDVVFRSGTKALILDYKVLNGDVAESSRNLQLRDLACLVYANVPLLDTVGTAIIQPMVTWSPEVCVYQKADLERAAGEMAQRIVASNNPQSKRVAGEKQCQWCKAKSVCAEFNRWQGALIPVDEPALFKVAMQQWTPAQRALAASVLPIAGKRLEEIKDFLKGLLAADASAIPGWHLADGNKREVIVDSQGVFDRFATLGGTLPQFLACIQVQKGKLEEAVNEATGAKGKALKAAMGTLLAGLTESKQNAPSLERVVGK
jgi:hypothetical protein